MSGNTEQCPQSQAAFLSADTSRSTQNSLLPANWKLFETGIACSEDPAFPVVRDSPPEGNVYSERQLRKMLRVTTDCRRGVFVSYYCC